MLRAVARYCQCLQPSPRDSTQCKQSAGAAVPVPTRPQGEQEQDCRRPLDRYTVGGVSRVKYFTACTLDGFIADENQSLEWLFEAPHGHDDGGWDEFIAGVGPMVMGANTYEWVLEHDEMLANPQKWHDFYGKRPCWVFTHRALPPIPTVNIRMVSGDVRPVYEEMVATSPKKHIWLVGGGDLVGQFDDAGLLDEIWLWMRPVFLGAGAPLLPRRITTKRLTLREVRHSGQQLQLILNVARHKTEPF
jgi:dihydrofolate reductase